MKPVSIIFILCFAICFKAYPQTLHWLQHVTANSQQFIEDMKADADGNLYICGQFRNDVNFAGVTFSNPQSRGFIAEFDSTGHLLWMHTGTVGPSNGDFSDISHIEISETGYCFFSGAISPGVNFNGFPSQNLPKDSSQAFIAKCDKNGNIQWIRKHIHYLPSASSTSSNLIYNFKVDKSENIYFSGVISDNKSGGAMVIDNKQYTSKKAKGFLVSFDSSAHLNWIAFNHLSRCTYIERDIHGNFYTGLPGTQLYSSPDSLIYKYGPTGNLLLSKAISNAREPFHTFITDKNGYIYTTVDSSQSKATHAILTKYDTNFNVIWQIIDKGPLSQSLGLTVNKNNGYIYMVCVYFKSFDFGGLKSSNAPNDTNEEASISKINTDGTVEWVKNSIGNHQYSQLLSEPFLIEDACNNFYFTMGGVGQVHFGAVNINNGADPNKFYTGFIAKFSSDTLGFTNNHSPCNLSLKNISKPAFKKFQWFAARLSPGKPDTTIGRLIATTRDLNYSFPHKGRYVITMQGNKAAGCTNITRDTFTVAGSPIAGFMAGGTEGCQYVNYSFTDTSHADSINKTIGESWYWDFGDAASGGSTLAYTKTKRPLVNHIYTQSGTYTVKLVYGNGICTDTFVSTQKVKIVPAPKPGFIVSARFDNFSKVVKSNSGDTVAGCAPLVINVNDNSEGTVVKYVYTVSALPINRDKPPAGDSLKVPSFSYSFLSPSLFVIHQYLTGTTGCITEDSAFVRVRAGVSATDKPVILRASFNGQNNVLLHWLPVLGAKRYSVFRYNGPNTSLTNAPKGDFLADIADTMFADNHVGISINPANVPNTGSALSPVGAGRFWNNVHYQITASDSCGNRTGFSNIARPILLTGQNINNQYFLINWTPYEKWDNGVDRYDIELQDNEGFFHPISNLTDTAYHDGGHFSLAQLGQCYRIKATEQDGNNQISYSNTLCIPYLPQIWVPNVFTPDNNTVNDSFKISTIGIKNYKLTVYNTWGEVVFSTSTEPGFPKSPSWDIGAGWDGRFHGQPVPEGVYFYTISAIGNAENFFQKGTVQVMR